MPAGRTVAARAPLRTDSAAARTSRRFGILSIGHAWRRYAMSEMAVSVNVDPEDDLTPRQRKEMVADVNLFIALRNQLAQSDLRALRDELSNVLVIDKTHNVRSPQTHPATGEPIPSEADQALLAFRSLLQF